MYKIDRANKAIKMEFLLGEKQVSYFLPDSITPGKIAEINGALVKARELPDKTEAYTAMGNAITELMTAVFGIALANEIIHYFDSNYEEMLTEVLPYIVDVVIPAIKKRSQERAKKLSRFAK